MRARVLVLVLITVLGWAPLALAAGRIVGRVVDLETSGPIEGAQVVLVSVGSPGLMPLTSQSDARGGFQFDAVAPGRYRLQASKVGLATVLDASPGAVITVAGDETVTVRDLVLRRGGVIAGRVVDARGEPVPELMVTAEPVSRDRPTAVATPVQTNDLGEFRLAGVPPGDMLVIVRPRPIPFGGPTGSTGYLATYYPGTAERARAVPVTIAAGQSVQGLDVTIQRGSLFTVSGVVVSEAGAPIGDVMVTLAPDGGSAGGVGLTRVDAQGTFTLRGVQAGSYRLMAMRLTITTAPGGAASVAFGDPSGAPPVTTVTVTDANVTGVRLVVASTPVSPGDATPGTAR